MTFTISMQEADRNGKQKYYRMEVEQTKATDWMEEYTVRYGIQEMVFRNDRPELRRLGRRKAIKWQVVSKNFDITDFKRATEFFLRIETELQYAIERPPTFQQMRNKS